MDKHFSLDEEIEFAEIEPSTVHTGLFEHWPGLSEEDKDRLQQLMDENEDIKRLNESIKRIRDMSAYYFFDPLVYRG